MTRTNAAWEDPEPIGSGSLRLLVSNYCRKLDNSIRQISQMTESKSESTFLM
jgi:hypothetical protein